MPDNADGLLHRICDSRGKPLAWGYVNPASNIIGRIVSFHAESNPEAIITENLQRAAVLRSGLLPEETTAFRLINAEGDSLPGLIVDSYDDILVVQIQTLGMERLKEEVIAWLIKQRQPRGIYERSSGSSRRREGLSDSVRVIYGEVPAEVQIRECGLQFIAAIKEGQKTGLFLDQRAMRQRVRELSAGRRVLNCFAYAGGFSINAYMGGADWVESVDISSRAIAWAEGNFALNKGVSSRWKTHVADVFDFLNACDKLDYDLVILDPPAFAKKQRDTTAACRGYRELHRLALGKLRAGSLLLTCSCSQPVSEELFCEQIFHAALDAKRSVRILERLRHSPDHPVSLFHPEGNYLKGFLLQVD